MDHILHCSFQLLPLGQPRQLMKEPSSLGNCPSNKLSLSNRQPEASTIGLDMNRWELCAIGFATPSTPDLLGQNGCRRSDDCS